LIREYKRDEVRIESKTKKLSSIDDSDSVKIKEAISAISFKFSKFGIS